MAGQGRGGNDGMSGQAMWKVKQQCAAQLAALPMNQVLEVKDLEPPDAPNLLVDACILRGPSADPKLKPLVRHVLVKDLNKIALRSLLELPKAGVFKNKAPMGLYAIFDGQSCAASTPGPAAAEFCARNFHTKLLHWLAKLPPDQATTVFVEAAIVGAFEDLDKELLITQTEITDGCGASIALFIGEHLFTAVVGTCSAILGERGGASGSSTCTATVLGNGRGSLSSPEECERLRARGVAIVGAGAGKHIRHPNGSLSSVSRSLGDRVWKDAKVGGAALVTCTPEVQTVSLKGVENHPFALLCASSVAAALTAQEQVDIADEFSAQPKAGSGEITTRAVEKKPAASAQFTTVQISFLAPKAGENEKKKEADAKPPPAKKAKTGAPGGATQSVRLRHILVRYQEGAQPAKEPDLKGKKVTRSKQQAETTLRKALSELRRDLKEAKKPPKDANEVVLITTKKFMQLAKEHSDCESSKKGGSMCGDLGWVTPEMRTGMGGSFRELTDSLQPGQCSDIAASVQGLHIIQRLA